MRIEVLISGGDQACCGMVTALGETAAYRVVALAPDAAGPSVREHLRFMTDNHGQAPADVPHARVAGVVRAITGVSYPRVPVAGMPGTRTADTTRPEMHSMAALGTGDDAPYSDYLVQLDVAEGVELPHYVASAEHSEYREREARVAALREQRANDEVGIGLRALAHEAEALFASTVQILGAATGSSVSITPVRDGAAAVHWIRSAEQGADGIRVQLGDGSWQLPATPEQVDLMHTFIEAAAAGRVEEIVSQHSDSSWQLTTRVSATDGRSWQATTAFSGHGRQGAFVAPRQLWNKLQRGDYRYTAWE